MAEGGVVALLVLVSKIWNLRLMGGFNGIKVKFYVGNYNRYSDPPHKIIKKSCPFLLFFLSIKSPPVHRNGTLKISFFLLYNFLDLSYD